MKKLLAFATLLSMAFIASCGGSDNTILNPGSTLPGGTQIAVIELSASSPTLNSSATGETTIQIFAVVKDSGNAVQPNVPVAFQTSSGSISGTQPTTDDTGTAIAELSNGGDPTNRAITVTATAGQVAGTITVQAVGTQLIITGPPALALNDTADYTVELLDSQGAGIQGTVNVSSANGNTLSAASVTTAVSGQAVVTLTASNAGVDTLTASGLGITATTDVDISGDVFSIQTPVAGQEINLNTAQSITLQWTQNGVPQVGETITFTATRGTLSVGTAVTDGNGEATISISSNSGGPSTISASNNVGTSTSVDVEFIATTAATLDLQANPLTVGVSAQSTLSATVRDANGNLVKNKVVTFLIEQDSTGNSFLSVGSDLTDSQGRATSVYTAGGVPSAANGVIIRATVQDTPLVTDTVPLTVAGRAIDMSIGTGDSIFEPTSSFYSQEWVIIVTDTTGTGPEPVANTSLQASIKTVSYGKGEMFLVQDITGNFFWDPFYSVAFPGACADEDTNQDGFLDLVAEDINGNLTMEAGNRATLVAVTPGAPDSACDTVNVGGGGPTTTVDTDDNGIARVCVVYPQSDNLWVEVKLASQLNVFGTEYQESQDFILPALASDLDDEASAPAGQTSPFGTAGVCTDPN